MFKKLIKNILNKNPSLKRFYYKQKIKNSDQIIAKSVDSIRKVSTVESASNSRKKVLIVTIPSLPTSVIVDMLLAKALERINIDVHILMIDPCLPADLSCEIGILSPIQLIRHGAQKLSRIYSVEKNINHWNRSGLKITNISTLLKYIDPDRLQLEVERALSKEGPLTEVSTKISEHALAGTLRYFAVGQLNDDDSIQKEVYKRYLQSGALVWKALEKISNQHNFDTFVCANGIYVPGGIVNLYANTIRKKFVCWNIAYRKKCVLFSHNDTYHHTLMKECPQDWDSSKFPKNWESVIDEYLQSRIDGGRDWIVFNKNAIFEDSKAVRQRLRLSKPTVLVLTNVVWDAQLHYPENAFKSMIDWLDNTIINLWYRSDLEIVIRIHPAELSGDIPTRQKVKDHIVDRFGDLPLNFRVIDADDKTSTYALSEICNAAIIYGTKTGLELTSRGIPVIVCGEAWVRNKGFTIDIADNDHYKRVIEGLPFDKKIDKSSTEKAKKYAYHFFFRRMIQLDSVIVTGAEPRLAIQIDDPDNFPNNDKGLLSICHGITEGRPFVYEQS
jgi:hypothetical protein